MYEDPSASKRTNKHKSKDVFKELIHEEHEISRSNRRRSFNSASPTKPRRRSQVVPRSTSNSSNNSDLIAAGLDGDTGISPAFGENFLKKVKPEQQAKKNHVSGAA